MSFDIQSNRVASLLGRITAFKELNADVLDRVSPLFHSKKFDANQIILSSGEDSTEVYFIVSGLVRATMYTPSGREVSYQDIPAGSMFGEMAAIDGMHRSTGVIAIEGTHLLVLSSKNFIDLISKYPSIGLATLYKITKVNRFLCERIYEFSALDVNHRVRAELLRLAEDTGADGGDMVAIPNMPTHQELANRLATHREAVTRELNSLEKIGVFKKSKRSMALLNVRELQLMIDD